MANQGQPTTGNADDRNTQKPRRNPANQPDQGDPNQGDPSDRGSQSTRGGQAGKTNDRAESMKEETEKSRGDA